MQSTGIVRKVDDLGRIVLPAEIRRMLDIQEGSDVEFYLENGRIVLCKLENGCIFCGARESLRRFHGKNLCRNCINTLRGLE
ncbi:MAG TPA: AbrB/MazE/SpoVT family DNA-binding domain-containing protein [Candidatus Faecousia intestinigallinarum]|nr:AbrB/MazE/SpoVT family DNA-binding domain-containing protein [Candidatus Faecousia intestinigallinarum]